MPGIGGEIQRPTQNGVLAMPTLLDAILGGALAAGGVAGFLRAGSRVSLVMGVGSGAVVILVASRWIKAMVTLVLTVMMGKRFYSYGKFMPSGMVGMASGLLAAVLTIKNAAQAYIQSVAQGEADMKKLLDERLAAHKHLSGA